MTRWLLIAEELSESADAAAGIGERIIRMAQSLVSAFFGLIQFVASPNGRLTCAFVLAAVGLWLLLPKGKADCRRSGMIVCFLAGCFFVSLFQPLATPAAQIKPGEFDYSGLLATFSFCVLASITVVSAVSTIVSRNPVYCAIWFAVTLLGVGGLFLLNGAHFLGVATVAVYAGAIVVTFLFVLMLAQPEGHAYYDRISWGGIPTALAVLAGLLIVATTVWSVNSLDWTEIEDARAGPEIAQVLNDQHVATLGGTLFSKYLIAIEMAGTLLLAALVGAVAIAGRDQLSGRTVNSAAAGSRHSETPRSGSALDA